MGLIPLLPVSYDGWIELNIVFSGQTVELWMKEGIGAWYVIISYFSRLEIPQAKY